MRRRRKKLSVTSESHKPLKSRTLKSPFKKKEEKACNNPLLILPSSHFCNPSKFLHSLAPFLNSLQKKKGVHFIIKETVLCNIFETQFVSNNHQE